MGPELPFKLGATSYVYPADWLVNARRLAFRVQDLALILDSEVLPDQDELRCLREVGQGANLSYTIHVQAAPELASARWSQRRRARARLKKALRCGAELMPHAYVLSLPGAATTGNGTPGRLATGSERSMRAVDRLLEDLASLLRDGGGTGTLCVRCTSGDTQTLALSERLDLPLALVVGSRPDDYARAAELIETSPERVGTLLWHGVDPDERAHRSLRHVPAKQARSLLDLLIRRRFCGVLTLNVFCERDFDESLELVDTWLKEHPQPNGEQS